MEAPVFARVICPFVLESCSTEPGEGLYSLLGTEDGHWPPVAVAGPDQGGSGLSEPFFCRAGRRKGLFRVGNLYPLPPGRTA